MTQPKRPTGEKAKVQTVEPVRYSIPPSIASELHVRTLPGAICVLRRDGDPDGCRSLRLCADQDGVVRLHVQPSREHSQIAKLVIDAEADGTLIQVPLELRPTAKPSKQMPAPPGRSAKVYREGAQVRPVLDYNDLLKLDDEETSRNWSGFELNGAVGTYDWVTGMWNVPTVTGESNSHTYSSFWIGLDGDGIVDLVQAGTGQQNCRFDFLFVHLTVSIYYAWTEFLPQQPTEQQIGNFPVNPGDEIVSQVWIGNAGSGPTLSGAFGVLLIENLTTSESTTVHTPVGSTVVRGSEAVWIMERPLVGTSLADLADYGSARMCNAHARRSNSARHGGYVPYQGANNKQISMVDGASTLSTVTPIDAYSMRFNWQGFH